MCLRTGILGNFLLGTLDGNEDNRAAAIRETKEEAGIAFEQLEVFDNVTDEIHYKRKGLPKVQYIHITGTISALSIWAIK